MNSWTIANINHTFLCYGNNWKEEMYQMFIKWLLKIICALKHSIAVFRQEHVVQSILIECKWTNILGTVCDTTTPPESTTMTTTGGTTPCATFTTGGNANGAMCTFPFTYNSVAYYECTTIDRDQLWCATTSNYNVGGVWGYCQGEMF